MLKIWSLALATLLLSACESKIEDLESEKKTSNIPVTETDGVVTGTIGGTGTADQTIVASASSDLADASVTFPSGTLTTSLSVSLGVAKDESAAILGELGITDAASQRSKPMFVGPTSDTVPDVVHPLTISLPLPIEEVETGLVEKSASKLILIYAIYDKGWKSGVIPLTAENLIGTFTNVPLQGFGYFQIVYVNTARSEKQVISFVIPSLENLKK